MRKLTLTITAVAAAAAVLGLTVPAAAPAQARDTFTIREQNGNQDYLSFDQDAAGYYTRERPGGRSIHTVVKGTDDNHYVLVLLESANGLVLTEVDCTVDADGGIDLGTDPTATGTIWVEYFDQTGDYLVNRNCSGGADHYGARMAFPNSAGAKLQVDNAATSGWYRKLVY